MTGVKIELQDNGGWYPSKDLAEWTTGACEDCDNGEQVKVLDYPAGDGYRWKVCEKHLEADEFVRIVEAV